jgi:hypothetical protein
MKHIESEKYIKQKLHEHIEFPCVEDKVRKRLIVCNLVEVQRAFEDGYECATKWIDVKDRLPEKDTHVLAVIKDSDNLVHTEIRWRSIYDDVLVDDNGFSIFAPIEKEVMLGCQYRITTTKRNNSFTKKIKQHDYN